MPANIGRIMLKQYLRMHEDVMSQVEKATGKRPAPYKDLEEKVLLELFGRLEEAPDLNGLDFIAGLLSNLITCQGLTNANHRTALYFVAEILDNVGLDVDLTGNSRIIKEFFLDSKHILRKGRKDFERQHVALTKKTLEATLGKDQSGKLESMDACFFITVLRDSANDF